MSNSKPIHVHRLSGCRPTPLVHYLKALGILRLISEQADPKARGWWRDDAFYLATSLDLKELESFFLDQYSPTPMTASWLSRSGYSIESSHSKTREWLTKITESEHTRFDRFRQCVKQFREFANSFGYDLSAAAEMRNPKFVNYARSRVEKSTRKWIDTSILPVEEKVAYPAIFGTGGNEGSGSYLANYYQALVVALLLRQDSINASMFSDMKMANTISASNRHNAGHYAESTGVDSPWTYILALEGSLLLTSSLSRQINHKLPVSVAGTAAGIATPFSVGSDCIGYGSSSDVDSKSNRQGKLVPGRGEQWMPIWKQPVRLDELQTVFREGRAIVRRKAATRSRDFCLSISRSGVARGISDFERFGFVQRNGDNHMAVPLGRFQVIPRPNQRLLDEVAPWLDRLRDVTSDKLAPQSFARAYRACELAIFNCARRSAGSDFLDLLVAMGEAEDQMVASPKFSADKCLPMPQLSVRWLNVIQSDAMEYATELRLAISLAAQTGPLESKAPQLTSPIRVHWLPIERTGRFAKGEQGLSIGPEQSAIGLDLTRAALAIIHRRLLALSRGLAKDGIPLRLCNDRFGARLDDIQQFLNQETDDARILSYARGMMSINFQDKDVAHYSNESQKTPLGGLALFGMFRLALPVGSISLPHNQSVSIRCNPTIFRRLQNGDLGVAIQIASRQLANSMLRPKLQVAVGTTELGRRIAAAMIFGLARNEWTRLTLSLTDPQLPAILLESTAHVPNELTAAKTISIQ